MDFLKPPPWPLALLGLAVLVLLALVVVLRRALRRRPQPPDPEAGLREDLAAYPPAPPGPLPRRLLVQDHPARLRLVVVAPIGKEARLDAANVEPLLEHVLHNLGSLARQDRPRVRVWPAQLSHHGFAVMFQRLTTRPDPEDAPSHWTLLAGRARVGQHFLLLGLAVWTEEPTTLGRLTLEPDRWPTVLRVTTPTT